MTRRAILSSLLPALLLAVAGCGGREAAGDSMSAIMPEADVVAHFDHKGALEAPIVKTLMERNQVDEQSMIEGDPDAKKLVDRIVADTGVHPLNDMAKLTLALKLEGVDLENIGGNIADLPFVAAFDMAEDMTNETLLAAGKILAEEEGGAAAAESGMVKLTPPEGDSSPEILAMAAGKVALFAADAEVLKSAAGRVTSGGGGMPASLASVKNTLPENAQIWVAAVMPDSVREKIKETTSGGGQQAGMLMPFEELKSLALSVRADSTLKISLHADVGAADKAGAAKGVLDAMLPMVKGMVPGLAQKPLAAVVDGTTVSLSVELTEADFPAPPAAPK